MGRRDAVQFTLEWAAEARRLGGIVEFEPGWETRGNGTSANYEGGIVHHTAFLSSEGNPFPAKNTLKLGRTDLPGPLCNVAGPWCEDGAPRLVVIAAHPANHAGASGGRSMGPLPVTSLFNPRVFGLEIDYGGVVPMTKGQRKAATIFGRALINVLARDAEYVRAHAETSLTGKWDIGVGDGLAHTVDMADFRRGVTNFAGQPAPLDVQEDDMPTVIVQPGESVAVPSPYGDTDLFVACDNPNGKRVDINGQSVLVEGVDLRIAVQDLNSPDHWRPVNAPGFPVNGVDQFITNIRLGDSRARIGGTKCVSVSNRGYVPVTVVVAPHAA